MKIVTEELVRRQLDLETAATLAGKMAYEKAMRDGRVLPPQFKLLSLGLPKMVEAVEAFKQPKTGPSMGGNLIPLINKLPSKDLAYITMWTMITAVPSGMTFQAASKQIGQAILDHIEYTKFATQKPMLVKTIESNLSTDNRKHCRTVLMRAKRKFGVEDEGWDQKTLIRVGSKFIQMAVESSGCWAVNQGIRDGNDAAKTPLLTVDTAPETQAYLDHANTLCSLSIPMFNPCVIAPQPWTAPTGGGFWSMVGSHNLKVIKTRNKSVFKTAMAEADMTVPYAALNAMQDTAWRVNKKVLHTLYEIWSTTSGMGLIPNIESVPLPSKAWTTQEEFDAIKAESPEVIKEYKSKAHEAHNLRKSVGSKALSYSKVIARAREFVDEPELYFCWTLDYRGRAYPQQLYVHPQAADVSRSMIEFAEGTPLGDHGAKWLAIHGANCYGKDKLPLHERIQWVKDHELQILASAASPLDVNFWRELDGNGSVTVEDPWQFLAFCFDWAGYVASGRSRNYCSHLAVSVDGSCNGLQHFAGLLLDDEGGRAVNLIPQDHPHDIYSQVKDIVIGLVKADLTSNRKDIGRDKAGKEKWSISHAAMAELWDGKIDRGMVKRGVMTTPYGVTKMGLKNQLMDELRKRGNWLELLDPKELWKAAHYLANRLYKGICKVVMSADTVMAWMKECSTVFNSAGLRMKWRLPSGFVAVQQYLEKELVRVSTYWGKQEIKVGLQLDTKALDKAKQRAGIAPNVIHSLDACHLMMTVVACAKAGIKNFAMVHDSYGCPAGQMETMSRILREEFVKLYTEDYLQNLYRQWKEQLPPELADTLPEPPQRISTLELALLPVTRSHYFFA